MSIWRKLLFNSSFQSTDFEKNTFTLFSGQLLAQIINFIFSFIVIKIYAIEALGVYAAFISISSILAIIAPLGFDSLIIVAKSPSERYSTLATSFINCFFFSFTSLILIFIFKDQLATLIKISKTPNLLFLLPTMIFLSGIIHSLNYLHNHLKTYSVIKNGNLIKTFSLNILAIALGKIEFKSSGLLLAQVTCLLLGVLYLYPKKITKKIIPYASFSLVKKNFKTFKEYSLFYSGSNLLNSITTVGTSILVISLFNDKIAGYYFIAEKIMLVPISLITGSVAKVFYKKGTFLFESNPKKLYQLILSIQKRILLLLLPVLLLLSLFSPYLFEFFGEKWYAAGKLIKYFSFFVLINSLVSPITYTFNIINKIKPLFWFNLILGSIRIGSFYFFHLIFNFEITILSSSIALSICYILLNSYLKKQVKKQLLLKENCKV